jgi:hypothetical protein
MRREMAHRESNLVQTHVVAGGNGPPEAGKCAAPKRLLG